MIKILEVNCYKWTMKEKCSFLSFGNNFYECFAPHATAKAAAGA